MAPLVHPNKEKHQYVVGIDFGHGETSAAVCPLEWDTEAGKQVNNFTDIDVDINGRKHIITSAICITESGTYIGDNAFYHIDDNHGIRLGFKQKPQSIDGEAEKLMIEFMKAVYSNIREIQPQLTDDNHIVYIARPSGWNDEHAKEVYQQMALAAGIPLAGLTSESRAAIFYAKGSNSFAKHIVRGAIVFDLGSSTLDFTHIADNIPPVDFGYNLGASAIDKVIFEKMIFTNDEIKVFLNQYPVYKDALLFKARKFKESVYSRAETLRTIDDFTLESFISEESEAFDTYAEKRVRLRVNNLEELNQLIESESNYMEKIREALVDFRDNHIPERTVNGVFLTGGASRMNFLRPIISNVFELPMENIQFDSDNSSLTVSRGITLLGVADAMTNVFVAEIKDTLSRNLDIDQLYSSFIEKLSKNIPESVWPTIESTVNDWLTTSTASDQSDIEKELLNRIKEEIGVFSKSNMKTIVSDALQECIIKENNTIRDRINDIIKLYAPGRELSSMSINESYSDNILEENMRIMIETIMSCVDDTLKVLGQFLFDIILLIIFGVFYLYVRGLIAILNLFRSAESRRKKMAKTILDKKSEIIQQMSNKLNEELNKKEEIKESIRSTFVSYLSSLLDFNLNQVKIPIE